MNYSIDRWEYSAEATQLQGSMCGTNHLRKGACIVMWPDRQHGMQQSQFVTFYGMRGYENTHC